MNKELIPYVILIILVAGGLVVAFLFMDTNSVDQSLAIEDSSQLNGAKIRYVEEVAAHPLVMNHTLYYGKRYHKQGDMIAISDAEVHCELQPGNFLEEPKNCIMEVELQDTATGQNISLRGALSLPGNYTGHFWFNSSAPNLISFDDRSSPSVSWSSSLDGTPSFDEIEEENDTAIITYRVPSKDYDSYSKVTDLTKLKNQQLGGKAFLLDPDISACGALVVNNTVYTQTAYIQTSGDCMVIRASNVTYNGNGFKLVYGNTTTSSDGFGVVSSRVNFTIRNAWIEKGVNASGGIVGTSSHAVNFASLMDDGGVINSTIIVKGSGSVAIRLTSGSNGNQFLNNTLMRNNSGQFLAIATVQHTVFDGNTMIGLFPLGGSDNDIEITAGGNNNITNNILNTTQGATSSTTGILSTSSNTYIYNNTFIMFALNTNASECIVITGASSQVINNTCYIPVSSATNTGIQISTIDVTVTGNNVTVNGTTGTIGISLTGDRVIFRDNYVMASGITDTKSMNLRTSENGSIENNIFQAELTQDVFHLSNSTTQLNMFMNNTIIGIPRGMFLNISSEDVNSNEFTNQYIANYSFNGTGSTITINTSRYGEVRFLIPVNGSDINLTQAIQISNYTAIINETTDERGLNRSSNITLYGFQPIGTANILRNGVACPTSTCWNFTAINASLVVFNTSIAGNYTINWSGSDTTPPTITFVAPSPSEGGSSGTSVILNVTITDDSPPTYAFFNDSLLAWFRFDNSSAAGENGTLIKDWSNHNHNATVTTGAVPIMGGGVFGGTYDFGGSTIAPIENPDNTLPSGSEDRTVAFWGKMDANFDGFAINYGDNGGEGNQFYLGVNPSSSCTSGSTKVAMVGIGGTGSNICGTTALNDSKWHHIAATLQGTTLRVYVDGVEEGSGEPSPAIDTILGQASIGGAFDNSQHWNGLIDEMLIFNRALNNTEIPALYNSSQFTLTRNLTGLTGFQNYTVEAIDSRGNRATASRSWTVGAGNSCTYSSGNWNVLCSDGCNITTNANLGGNNITITGAGKFNVIGGNITNFAYAKIYTSNLCTINTKGGRFI